MQCLWVGPGRHLTKYVEYNLHQGCYVMQEPEV